MSHRVTADDPRMEYSENSDFDRPLLTTPFRRTQILPIVNPPSVITDPAGLAAILNYLRCPSANTYCQLLTQQTTAALVLFALSHELSHIAVHHVISDEGTNLDQEKAADRNAVEIMRQFAGIQYTAFNPEAREKLEFAARTVPMVFW